MNKNERKKINAALAAVTDVQMQVHSPQPAPTPDTYKGPLLLLPLSRRLKRYRVLAQVAKARQKDRLLEFLRQAAQSIKPHAKPMLDALFLPEVPADMNGSRFMELADTLMTEIGEAINAVDDTKTEQDKLDELFQDGFQNELRLALRALERKQGNSLAMFDVGVFQHEGIWGVFATKCNCPGCTAHRMVDRMTSVRDLSQEEIDAEIAELLQQHPGAVEIASLDGLDLSDHSNEDRAGLSKEFEESVAEGSRVFDLGHGNKPRFIMIETKVQGVEIDLGNLGGLGDLLGAPGSILGSILGGVGLMKPADVPQEVIDRKIAEVLEEHPGAVRITSLDGVDMSDLTEEQRSMALERLPKELEEGVILFDLGHGKKPRFHSLKTVGGKVSIDLGDMAGLAAIPGAIFGSGLDLAEMFAGAMPADRKSDSSGGKSKRPRGPFRWFSDMIRGQA